MKFEKDILKIQKLSDSELETTTGGKIGFDSEYFRKYLDSYPEKFVVSRYIGALGEGLLWGCDDDNDMLKKYGETLREHPASTAGFTLLAVGSMVYTGYRVARGCVLGIKRRVAKKDTK